MRSNPCSISWHPSQRIRRLQRPFPPGQSRSWYPQRTSRALGIPCGRRCDLITGGWPPQRAFLQGDTLHKSLSSHRPHYIYRVYLGIGVGHRRSVCRVPRPQPSSMETYANMFVFLPAWPGKHPERGTGYHNPDLWNKCCQSQAGLENWAPNM